MSRLPLLNQVPLFAALTDSELTLVEALCTPKEAAPGEIIVRQNTTGSEMYILANGAVEVYIEGLHDKVKRPLIVLGKGQVVGEMALIDAGYRSASVRATQEGCIYYVIERDSFEALCRSHLRIGYIVMRNLAIDLAFKLRHRNLTEM